MNTTIVGGGFGGVKAALEIARDPKNEVVLISNKPDFQYYPALYSSATGHGRRESWVPLGEVFARYPNVTVYIDTVTDIDIVKKTLTGESGATYPYANVIFSMGVVTTYFNIPGLETYAYGIKSAEEIQRLKHRLYMDIAEEHVYDKNYVIIGAGPTGVELAAALGTYIRRLAKFYNVRERKPRIRLIEAAPRVLPRSSAITSSRTERRLRRLGVSVETNKKVERATATELIVGGKPLASHTVIWTSGVTNHPFFAAHSSVFTLAPNGKVKVNEYLEARPHVYVIGDNAATPYSGLAQTALHDAKFVARNLRRRSKHVARKEYRPLLPVQAVPIGAGWAVVEWKWLRFHGWFGAFLRRSADLIGYLDVLPIGTSLSSWSAALAYENDYFTPSERVKKRR